MTATSKTAEIAPISSPITLRINALYDRTIGRLDDLPDQIIYALRPTVLKVGEPVVTRLEKLSGLFSAFFYKVVRPVGVKIGDPLWRYTWGIVDGETPFPLIGKRDYTPSARKMRKATKTDK